MMHVCNSSLRLKVALFKLPPCHPLLVASVQSNYLQSDMRNVVDLCGRLLLRDIQSGHISRLLRVLWHVYYTYLTCIYMYAYAYTCTHTYAHTHTRTHTNMNTRTQHVARNVCDETDVKHKADSKQTHMHTHTYEQFPRVSLENAENMTSALVHARTSILQQQQGGYTPLNPNPLVLPAAASASASASLAHIQKSTGANPQSSPAVAFMKTPAKSPSAALTKSRALNANSAANVMSPSELSASPANSTSTVLGLGRSLQGDKLVTSPERGRARVRGSASSHSALRSPPWSGVGDVEAEGQGYSLDSILRNSGEGLEVSLLFGAGAKDGVTLTKDDLHAQRRRRKDADENQGDDGGEAVRASTRDVLARLKQDAWVGRGKMALVEGVGRGLLEEWGHALLRARECLRDVHMLTDAHAWKSIEGLIADHAVPKSASASAWRVTKAREEGTRGGALESAMTKAGLRSPDRDTHADDYVHPDQAQADADADADAEKDEYGAQFLGDLSGYVHKCVEVLAEAGECMGYMAARGGELKAQVIARQALRVSSSPSTSPLLLIMLPLIGTHADCACMHACSAHMKHHECSRQNWVRDRISDLRFHTHQTCTYNIHTERRGGAPGAARCGVFRA
jgi:hypothetical protein